MSDDPLDNSIDFSKGVRGKFTARHGTPDSGLPGQWGDGQG
jgi:hypothetical protein